MQKEELPAKQITQLIQQKTIESSKNEESSDEEESGLLFVDPAEEKLAQIEKDK